MFQERLSPASFHRKVCSRSLGEADREEEQLIKVLFVAAALTAVVFAGSALAAGAGGVSGPAFYVDAQLYRTVGTPTT